MQVALLESLECELTQRLAVRTASRVSSTHATCAYDRVRMTAHASIRGLNPRLRWVYITKVAMFGESGVS